MRRTGVLLASLAGSLACAGCKPAPGGSEPPGAATSDTAGEPAPVDPLAIHDELEASIAAETDSEEQRKAAYEKVSGLPDDGSAEYALARAALSGRLAETRGLKAGKLVTETEQFARLSHERNPELRDGAARRMLGTLYVLAPPRLVEHGDSEVGLEMLEELVAERPDDPRARLRLAEAYIALGDPDPAIEHLCPALAAKDSLPADERRLADRLVTDAGGREVVVCEGGGG